MKTYPRLLPETKESYFLFGPRGTGKSTWLSQTCKNALLIDLLSSENYLNYSSSPDRLFNIIAANEDKKVVIIDEVQRIPGLLPVVHKIMEERKDLQFILTGSSARKIKREGSDLLAGRALLKQCHPFMACELKDDFNITRALETGLVPLVFSSASPKEVLAAYISLYLKEEVQNEGIVRNIGNFSRFIEAISFSHGSLLNISAVSRECGVERKTVEGYINVLEDLLLAYRIPVFAKRAKRHLVRHQKFYFFDCGVFNSIRPKGPLDNPAEISGQVLEGLIFQHLVAWNDYSVDKAGIYFWRTKSGVEVDFIIYGINTFIAIEIKSSKKVHQEDVKNLRNFLGDYPQAKALLLYMGNEKIIYHDILCMPCEEFLLNLVPGKAI